MQVNDLSHSLFYGQRMYILKCKNINIILQLPYANNLCQACKWVFHYMCMVSESLGLLIINCQHLLKWYMYIYDDVSSQPGVADSACSNY